LCSEECKTRWETLRARIYQEVVRPARNKGAGPELQEALAFYDEFLTSDNPILLVRERLGADFEADRSDDI